jgi:hypothetical protein
LHLVTERIEETLGFMHFAPMAKLAITAVPATKTCQHVNGAVQRRSVTENASQVK